MVLAYCLSVSSDVVSKILGVFDDLNKLDLNKFVTKENLLIRPIDRKNQILHDKDLLVTKGLIFGFCQKQFDQHSDTYEVLVEYFDERVVFSGDCPDENDVTWSLSEMTMNDSKEPKIVATGAFRDIYEYLQKNGYDMSKYQTDKVMKVFKDDLTMDDDIADLVKNF